jgi:hypothetical protein
MTILTQPHWYQQATLEDFQCLYNNNDSKGILYLTTCDWPITMPRHAAGVVDVLRKLADPSQFEDIGLSLSLYYVNVLFARPSRRRPAFFMAKTIAKT